MCNIFILFYLFNFYFLSFTSKLDSDVRFNLFLVQTFGKIYSKATSLSLPNFISLYSWLICFWFVQFRIQNVPNSQLCTCTPSVRPLQRLVSLLGWLVCHNTNDPLIYLALWARTNIVFYQLPTLDTDDVSIFLFLITWYLRISTQ